MTFSVPDLTTIEVTEPDDAVALVTLKRPDRLNAITSTMITELEQVVAAVDADPTLRAVIVTGAGRGFSAGLDLQEQGVAPGAETVRPIVRGFMWQDHLATLHEKIHRSRKPWIAAVNGPCVGGGFAMSLACDIRFAAASATFGAVFLKIGVSNCDMGTSYFLPRLVGASRSAELMLTARIFDAAEAEAMGLVLDVVDYGEVVNRALETAQLIRENAPFATWMTKETMWQTIDAPSLRHALDIENRTQIMCTATGDTNLARTAFMEKRPPEWGDCRRLAAQQSPCRSAGTIERMNTDYRRWMGVSAILAGCIAVAINYAQGDTAFATLLLLALAVLLVLLLWWTQPSRGGPHVGHAAAQAAAGDGDVIVYWTPGCVFCDRLKVGLGKDRNTVSWVNILRDPEAAEFVAGLHHGDETVPTAITGGGEVIKATPTEIRTHLARPR